MSTMKRRLFWYMALALTMIGGIGAIVAQQRDEPSDPVKQQEATDLRIAVALAKDVRAGLKNPSGFDLVTAAIQQDGSVCMTYRATNSFNAVVTAQAVRPQRGKAYWVSQDGAEFKRQWSAVCTGAGVDQARMVKHFM